MLAALRQKLTILIFRWYQQKSVHGRIGPRWSSHSQYHRDAVSVRDRTAGGTGIERGHWRIARQANTPPVCHTPWHS
jgi:hypothetical protein